MMMDTFTLRGPKEYHSIIGVANPSIKLSSPVVDLAMNCVESAAMDRPTMTEVVSRLKVLLPTVPSEKQYASASSRCTNSMDAEM